VSSSVNGVEIEKTPFVGTNGKVENSPDPDPGVNRVNGTGIASTDHDTQRHAGRAPPVVDVSSSVIVCQSRVYLDFETRNTGGCDLKEAGAWRYAVDPATEPLTLTYQNGDGEPRVWTPAEGRCDPLAALAADPAVAFVCFGDFDIAIWQHIMMSRFGFPVIPTSRWVNAQATCSYLALPRKLEEVLPVIGSDIVKDKTGRLLVLSLSRRDRKTGKYPEVTPEGLARVAAYNKIDVDGLVAVHAATGPLPERERRVWELDQAINRRGFGIDSEFARAAKSIAESSREALFKEFAALTGGLKPSQVDRTLNWLKGCGFTFANLQASTIEDALEALVLPDDVRRVLQIRLITGPTSLKKLDAMLACAGADGRARGLFQYHAATPGRWSATLLQPQNLPRPTVDIAVDDIEALVAAIKTGDGAALTRWGSPIDVLMSALRFAVVAADGSQFGVGDFSQIEPSVLFALAGQHDKCKLIEAGTDIHRDMAASIFKLNRGPFLALPKEALTVEQQEQRQTGKNTIMGCCYAMGSDKFRLCYLRHLEIDDAKRLADNVIRTYRKEWAPKVPKLWNDLRATALRAMLRPGTLAKAECGITYKLDTVAGLPCLVCTLLNGKPIHYMNARVANDKTDRFGWPVWSYWAMRDGHWCEIEPHGGHLTENVVQALARELLVDALFRFEARGLPIVMHCHDEIVVEHPDITAERMTEIMAESPAWAAALGVPISVKSWVGKRYRK
jgi:DNA polymerase